MSGPLLEGNCAAQLQETLSILPEWKPLELCKASTKFTKFSKQWFLWTHLERTKTWTEEAIQYSEHFWTYTMYTCCEYKKEKDIEEINMYIVAFYDLGMCEAYELGMPS